MINSQFYTIEEIKAKNIKSLENFEAKLNNTSVLLLASEAKGKTNLWYVANLIKNIPSAIVTKGKEKGEATIIVSRGDNKYTFCFSFTADNKHKLTTYVEGEERAITKHRQAHIIEQLIAPSFDIDELINSKGQKQVEIIKQVLRIDTAKEEAYYQQMFDARRDYKRDLKNNPKPTEVKEVKEVSLNELLANKKTIEDFNKVQDDKQKVVDYYLGMFKKLNNQISTPGSDSYLAYIAETNNIHKDIMKFITENIQKLDQPEERKSLNEVSQSIGNAEKTNSDAITYKNYLTALNKHNEVFKKVEEADAKVKEAREQLLKKIQEVEIPIEGLEFDISMSDAGTLSTNLMYNGLCFNDSNVNTSKKMAICARLQMNLFKEGNLGVMHVNASVMSKATLTELSEECQKMGIQVLFEVTSREDNEPLKVESIL